MDDADHEHRWVLVSAVLDGAGSLRVWACDEPWCEATAVQPASGDQAGHGPRKPESSAGHDRS